MYIYQYLYLFGAVCLIVGGKLVLYGYMKLHPRPTWHFEIKNRFR